MDGTAQIDWEGFRKNIHTPNVVDRIKSQYDTFLEAEFLVDGAVAKCGVRSEAMKSLDVSMHYNYELWLTHYLFHLDQIETMTNLGDVTAISNLELSELVPEGEAYTAGQ